MNIKPNQSSLPSALPDIAHDAKFDVDELLGKCGLILQREIRNLLMNSLRGKLDKTEATDLVAYVKLLSELKAEQQDALKDMSTEELEAAASQK